MTGALGIGAVIAVVRDLLDNGMVDAPAVGPVSVTAVAPDTIALDGPQDVRRLNVFLHRVTPNQGWRNAALPAYSPGGTRLTNPPLAVDLHFLVTAYGTADLEAEILLGYAMQILHERPVLDRGSIRASLDASPIGGGILPPAFLAVSASTLADQAESVTVTLDPIDGEEMSRLWSAMQAHYRPSAAYIASVVLIEATQPAKSALPVLSRGPVDPATKRDRGVAVQPDLLPPLPTIERVVRAGHERQPAVRLGEQLRIEGHHLDGTGVVVGFAHPLLDTPQTIMVGANADPHLVEVTLPVDGDNASAVSTSWPAGIWSVTVDLVRPGELVARRTNVAPMMLAPVPMLPPPPPLRPQFTPPVLTRDPQDNLTVTLMVEPHVRGSQQVTLALGTDVVPAEPHPGSTNTLTFAFGNVPAGDRWVRLTVDGVESILVDRDVTPPAFDPEQSVVVPA